MEIRRFIVGYPILEDPRGVWLTLADHLTEISELKAEIERLNKALEFAGYMKSSAEHLLSAQEKLNRMYGEDGEAHDPDDIWDAELRVGEATQALRSAIYEFNKRVAKAEALSQSGD